MKIHLPAYPTGIHQIREELDPAQLDLDLELFRAVRTDLRLDRHDPYLQFEFGLEADVDLECDRCLSKFLTTVASRSPMIYVLGASHQTKEIDDPNLVIVPAHTTELDISSDIRDALILALPGKRLCKENCMGLCPVCGSDLNEGECQCTRNRV